MPLMDKFKKIHNFYPKYTVVSARYCNFNTYLYCKEYSMEKYMRFTMLKRKYEKYHGNPYRAVNLPFNEKENSVCPNGKEFHYFYTGPVKGN